MSATGGRRRRTLAGGLALALLAAACSGGSGSDGERGQSGGEAEDVEVTPGGGGSGVSGSFFSFDPGSAAAVGSSGPGLSVRGVAGGTVPADLAFVVIVPPLGGFEGFGESGLAPEDRKKIVDGIVAMGVPRADVTFETDPRFGGQRVQVKVPVAQVGARGPRIVENVERTLGRSSAAGVTFSLANCEPASGPIRKQAMTQAEAQAKALAEAGKLSLGGIVSIHQDSDASFLQAPAPSGACPLVRSGQIDAFDARPEVRLSIAVSVTYAITGAPAGSQGRPLLFAAGSATAKTKADEAYVLVLFESEDEEPTGGPSAEDRTRTTDALAKLKIAKEDVEITTRSDYGVTTIVQVETKAEGLATSGKEIVRAVEDVLGRSDTTGARFWSSACTSVLGKARKDAVANARQRATTLAEAAGVKLGDMQWVSESSPTGADPCDDSVDALFSLDSYVSSPLQPFDADPEFVLVTSAQLGFAIA
jgi:uncharacterized protein YggE